MDPDASRTLPPRVAEDDDESLLWLLPPRSCSEEVVVASTLTHSVTNWATSERWLVSPSMYRELLPPPKVDDEDENKPLRRLEPASLLSSLPPPV
jgi:hypothetical protein